MKEFPPLASFGHRICICGPSNAGKSTLARALGEKLDAPVIYLDLLRHLPFTNWAQRPDDEFARLHAEAIEGPRWIIEGNYATLLPPRLQRATGLIHLGSEPWRQFARYLRRTLFEKQRIGQLEGNRDSIKWQMIRWILIEQPSKHEASGQRLRASGLPLLELSSMRELNALYAAWALKRQAD